MENKKNIKIENDEIILNKFEKHVEKNIITEKKMSFKEFIKLQQK